MNNDLLYQIALTKIPNIGHVHAKMLIRSFENAEQVFNTPRNKLEKIDGIGFVDRAFGHCADCGFGAAFAQSVARQPRFDRAIIGQCVRGVDGGANRAILYA